MPAHSKRRKRRVVRGDSKIILRAFLLFSTIILLFGGILKLASSWQNRIWLGNTRVTFVASGNPVKLFSWQKGRELVSVQFPQGVQINAAQGMGEWQLESLWDLGKTRQVGGELLVKSMQYWLNVPVDGFFAGEFNTGFPGNLAIFFNQSNFTVFDKLKIFVALGFLGAGEQKNYDAQKLRIVKEQRLVDGSLGWKLVPEQVENFTTREFQDAVVAHENSGIGVINPTQVPGAGEKVAQVLKTMGTDVVWLKSKAELRLEERCVLRVREITTTSFKIARVFSCKVEFEKGEGKLSAPIEFIIGQELAEEIPN